VSEKFSIFREAGNPACIHPTPLTVAPFHSSLATERFALTQCFIIGTDIWTRVIRMKQRRPFRSPHVFDGDAEEVTVRGVKKLDSTGGVGDPDWNG
jgi:hypothetical protein